MLSSSYLASFFVSAPPPTPPPPCPSVRLSVRNGGEHWCENKLLKKGARNRHHFLTNNDIESICLMDNQWWEEQEDGVLKQSFHVTVFAKQTLHIVFIPEKEMAIHH